MIEQQFFFKDKNGNELQTINDMGLIAVMFNDSELIKPMDGAALEMYLVTHHMKVYIDGIEYHHNGCSWGINQPDVFVYTQV